MEAFLNLQPDQSAAGVEEELQQSVAKLEQVTIRLEEKLARRVREGRSAGGERRERRVSTQDQRLSLAVSSSLTALF